MDVKNYRKIRENIRRKQNEMENRTLKDQKETKNNVDNYVKSHPEHCNALHVNENNHGNQGHSISISAKKVDKSINIQVNTRNYPYLLFFNETKKLDNQTLNSIRRLRSTASDPLFLEFINNAIIFASSLLNSTGSLYSSELQKLTIDMEAKIASEPSGIIRYNNEIIRIRKIVYDYAFEITKHTSDYSPIPFLFFSNEDAKYFLYGRDPFAKFERVSPGMLGIQEIELLRNAISTYGVSNMEEWGTLINNYFNKARANAILELNKISKSQWFITYTSLLMNNMDGYGSQLANFFKNDLEKDITKLLNTNSYPFLFERQTILHFAELPLNPSDDFNFFLLLSELYERNKYPGYNVACGRIRSQIVGFLDNITLISDRRFMVIPVVTELPDEFDDEKKTSLFIVTK